MAFLGRFGGILKQAAIANRQITSEIRSTPSVFQAIRCMSSTPTSKLFIGGISYSTDEQSLREAFSKYGEIIDARIIMDRDTGRSRGFGFVTFTSVEEASSAIQALDGQDLHGRRVRVNYAAERPRGFGGGGYGNAPYGASAGAGYGVAYGNAPYGGAGTGGGGSYGNAGAYDGNAAGGYGGSGGNFGGSGMNYGNDGNFATGSYGGNSGNFGVAGDSGGSDSCGSAAGTGSNDNYGSSSFGGSDNYVSAGASGGSGSFASDGYDGNAMGYGSGGAGVSGHFASGYDGSSGQLDSKESLNTGEDVGNFGEPSEGNYRDDDDTGDFVKRA